VAERQHGRQLPIGYWLKRIDALLTEQSDAALAGRGFTRLRWQLLNTVAEAGTASREQIHDILNPFASAEELDRLAAGLVSDGLFAAASDGERLSITEAGKAEHGRLLELQQTVRTRAFAGISPEEYATTMDVLQRVARNLSEPPAPDSAERSQAP